MEILRYSESHSLRIKKSIGVIQAYDLFKTQRNIGEIAHIRI